MGTELQYAIAIDVLAANFSPNNRVGDCTTCRSIIMQHKAPNDGNSRGIQLRDSMDRVLDQQNQEIIKKTMLMHEDVFKQQVTELHRLYSVQRTLTDELKIESRHGGEDDQAAGPSTRVDGFDEECGVDLTLSIGIGGSSSASTSGKNKSIGCWESSSSNNENTKNNRSRGGDGEDCNAISRSSSSAATVDQQQQQQIKGTPHWLFQSFSLK